MRRELLEATAASRGWSNTWQVFFWPSYAVLAVLGYEINKPGRVIADSLYMVLQARGVAPLSDWHPPMITYLWSVFDFALGQPASALFVQCLLLFVLPAALIADTAVDMRYRAASRLFLAGSIGGLALLVVMSLFLVGFVFKDVTLTALLMILMFLVTRTPSGRGPISWRSPAILAAVFLITMVRPTNAIWLLMVLALLALRRHVFELRRLVVGLALAAVVALTCQIAGDLVNYTWLDAKKTPVAASLIIFDTAGISVKTGRDLFADLPGWDGGIPRVDACYTPKWWDTFADWGECRQYYHAIERLFDDKGRGFLVRWWLGAIRDHPLEYLAHRFDFARQLFTSSEQPDHYFHIDNTGEALRFLVPDHVAQFRPWPDRDKVPLMRFWIWLTAGPLGQPYAWVGFALVGLAMSARKRFDDRHELVAFVAFAIAASNALMHTFLGVANSPRYLLPTLMLSMFGFIQLMRSRQNNPLA